MQVEFYYDFNGMDVGSPEIAGVQTAGAVTVKDMPNWAHGPEREKWVPDHYLDVKASEGSPASVGMKFSSLDSGILEFDLFTADNGSVLSVALTDGAGNQHPVFGINSNGSFLARSDGTEKQMRDTVEYRNRWIPWPLSFEPGRWYTFRLEFNAADGQYSVVIIDMCSNASLEEIERYMVLGSDLKFSDTSGLVNGVTIGFGDGHCLLDNLAVAGPVGSRRVNGKDIRNSLRVLLDQPVEPRRDPLELKLHSIRHTVSAHNLAVNPHVVASAAYMRPQDDGTFKDIKLYNRFFREAACRYNDLLVRQAFIAERWQMLERTAHYLNESGRMPGGLSGAITATVSMAMTSEAALADAYRAYACAYLDGLNMDRLDKEFFPSADQLAGILLKAEKLLDRSLKLIPNQVLAARREYIPVPQPLPRERPVWQGNGFFYSNGKPAYLFPQVGLVGNPEIEKSLRLEPVLTRLLQYQFLYDDIKPEEGKTFIGEGFRGRANDRSVPVTDRENNPYMRLMSFRPEGRLFIYSAYGSYYMFTPVPGWWYSENRSDPDIFWRDDQGEPHDEKSNWRSLNFWNPRVRQMLRDSNEELSAWVKETASKDILMYEMGVEASYCTSYCMEPGLREDSAIGAFHRFLEDEYGSIDKLNVLWGTKYSGFEEIRTGGMTELSGRGYEYRRFRQYGYRDWRRLCRDAIRKNTPEIPVSADFQEPFGYAVFTGSLWFEDMVDIVGFHPYQEWKRKPANRWMDSNRKVFSTTLGNFEWGATQNLGAMFEEEAYKNNGLQAAFHMMMWGQSVISPWFGDNSGWTEGCNWTESRLGLAVLRYSSTYIPLLKDRCERIGYKALMAPSVTPDVVILEPTSSGFSNRYGNPVAAIRFISGALESAGFNYGFVYEHLLLDGRQSLAGTQGLFIPSGGVTMPVELARIITDWVRRGGILISYSLPGIFNQYGRPQGSGHILENAFPGVVWEDCESGSPQIAPTKDGNPVAPTTSSDHIDTFEAVLDRGRVVIVEDTGGYYNAGSLADRFVTRRFYSRDNIFDLCMRHLEGKKYLYVLNPSLDRTCTGDIVIGGQVGRVVDRNIQRPAIVPVNYTNGISVINMRLAPAEGTLLEIDPCARDIKAMNYYDKMMGN